MSAKNFASTKKDQTFKPSGHIVNKKDWLESQSIFYESERVSEYFYLILARAGFINKRPATS